MKKVAVAVMVSLALAGIAQGAAAQYLSAGAGGQPSPWYLGLGFSQSEASIPQQTIDRINSTLSTAYSATATIVNKDQRSTGMKGFLGYGFNRYFAVEGGYAYLGKTSVNMDFRKGSPVSTSAGTFETEYKMSATFLDAVGMFPLNEKWSLLGRVGGSYNRVSASLNGSPLTIVVSSNDQTKNNWAVKFGAGVDYNFSPAFAARLEWERYNLVDPLSDEKFHVDTGTLSLLFHF